MKKISVAVIGASGLVGEKIIEVLQEQNLLKNVNLVLFVSQKSANEQVFIQNKKYHLFLLCEENIKEKFDIVFFSAGEDVSRKWAKYFAYSGSFVIDNSNAFRREKNIPLVVPEINANLILAGTRIIANPNCSTIQLALVLNAIGEFDNIEKIVISTYQSVSGAGKRALEDLQNGTNYEITQGIRDNVIAQIGEIEANEFCTEENKMMFELNKILNTNLSVCTSTVRVPVPFCHTESVYIKFFKNVKLTDLKSKIIQNNIIYENLSLPTKIANTNETHVCRLRKFSENEICFFIVADNLRRGAAYNAVMIAKYIIEKIMCINNHWKL